MAWNEPKIVSEKEQEFSFSAYANMEDLLDKLKLLNYEVEFLNTIKMRPIHRYYFVNTKNPGEQFYLFSLLAAWLIQKCGKTFEKPQEFDDPNETITNILNTVKEIGISVNFSTNKLKQGVGEQVVFVLDCLVNEALKHNNFVFKTPKLTTETEEETEQIDDELEINLDRVEEEMIAAYSDDSDEENLLVLDRFKPTKKVEPSFDLNQTVSEETWKMELERVLPQLKVTIKNNNNRDWRARLEQMKQFQSNINTMLIPTSTQLRKLYKEVTSVLDKIANREKYLNRELENSLNEYRMSQDQLSKIREKYKNISGGVAERNKQLLKLTDRLETVKQQMDERGSSMTDGTPLVNIRKSVTRVKAEIIDMDIRIGVLECILLQSKINDEKQLENDFGQTISVF